jgi:hypothetical protein
MLKRIGALSFVPFIALVIMAIPAQPAIMYFFLTILTYKIYITRAIYVGYQKDFS